MRVMVSSCVIRVVVFHIVAGGWPACKMLYSSALLIKNVYT
jgi:hypothetical protein